jgi:hypothetical protein
MCMWQHESDDYKAPMLCRDCADKEGVVRVPCTYHAWFLCKEKHDFGEENMDYDTGEHGDMTTYCSMCDANANFCAKMESGYH